MELKNSSRLKTLSDLKLAASTERTVASERVLSAQVIEHLQEIERRRLFARLGYSSMYDYCTKALRYCPASAQLRIDAVRLSQEVPEVQEALEKGSVSLSSVGVLQKWIREEKTESGKIYNAEQKKELFGKIEHIEPYARGGSDRRENLTLLCKAHNRERARVAYGERKLAAYGERKIAMYGERKVTSYTER